ncbi:hypothetical protein [Subtercola endophyticus]|uniref:hypothetical protein n=1 Tax=Subtercola endophyticus TaxID=2895559 RepID=UPI001E4A2F74|nr:hypothetical protein [Subtercola endophyticus]UFS58007.1 hypothetical protein LQ955_13380 [Subtercola endophyticus]
MPQLSLTYDREANGFECYLPDRIVHAPLAPSHPVDAISVSAVGSHNGDLLRLAYSSRSDDGARVIVIVHVDARTGALVDAPSISDTIDAELADAFLEAAAETVNPAGALRDLIDFRPEALPGFAQDRARSRAA